MTETPWRGILVATALKSDKEALSSSAVAPPTSIDFSAFVSVLTATGRNSIPMSFVVAIDDQVWINFVNNWIIIKRQNGYFTAGAGKVFHSAKVNDRASWDFYEDEATQAVAAAPTGQEERLEEELARRRRGAALPLPACPSTLRR